MQIQEAIHSRRTAHLWQDVPVPEEAILRGLEAAQMAPCHRLTWPWRFTLPGPSARSRLYDIGVELKAAKAGVEPSEELRERMVAKMRHPALIVVSQLVSKLNSQNGRTKSPRNGWKMILTLLLKRESLLKEQLMKLLRKLQIQINTRIHQINILLMNSKLVFLKV